MSRLTLAFALAAAFLLGAAVGVTVARASAPRPAGNLRVEHATVGHSLAPSNAVGSLRTGVPTVRPLPVVAPASLAVTAAPADVPGVRSPVPAPTATASPRPSRVRHAVAAGIASWYDARPGAAAAGPALRRALGKAWRGSLVTVCASSCVRVVLSDWMANPKALIDLNPQAFTSACGRLSIGLCKVRVEVSR